MLQGKLRRKVKTPAAHDTSLMKRCTRELPVRMKTLGIFRHAKSDWNDARLRDFDRPLNKRGRKGAAVMGKHILEHAVGWKRVLASPAVRVTQMIELAGGAAGEPPPRPWDPNGRAPCRERRGTKEER